MTTASGRTRQSSRKTTDKQRRASTASAKRLTPKLTRIGMIMSHGVPDYDTGAPPVTSGIVWKHPNKGSTTRALPGTTPAPLMARRGCCWPVSDGPGILFCDAPRPAGASYCDAHAKIGFRPVASAWEDRT